MFVSERSMTARNTLYVAPRGVKTGSRSERSALRRRMLSSGGTLDDVVAEMRRRWGFRPRVAYRHAYGWSQEEVAVRFREVAGQLSREPASTPMPAIVGARIGEYERWPQGGRRPSPYVLAVLGEVYGTTVGQLLDAADRDAMPAPDRAVVAALVDRQIY